MRTVCNGAFAECENLQKAVLNEGLEILGDDETDKDEKRQLGVFERSALEHVELPSTLKEIKCGAFYECRNLGSVSLPNGLEKIGKGCFFSCDLKEIIFSKSMKEIGSCAFCGCESLKTV